MFSYDCMRILLMMLDCAVVHSTATWASNSLKGHPFVCSLGLQSFKGTYLATVLQSWFIGVRFFKAEICPGSHSLRGYQWSLKDSGARVRTRIARGMVYLSIYLPIYLSLSLSLSLSLWIVPSICLFRNFNSNWKEAIIADVLQSGNWELQNPAILWDVLKTWKLTPPKWRNSTRCPQFLAVTISKTKQLCETSFKNEKLSAELTALRQCVLGFSRPTSLKYCDCQEKVKPRHTKCYYACHAKSSKDLSVQNATPIRKSAPWPLNMSAGYVFCIAPATRDALWHILSNVPRLPSFLKLQQNPLVWFSFDKLQHPLRRPRKMTIERPKVVRFSHFDFEMCFAPQRCALFRNLNRQFSTRLTSKCASRHRHAIFEHLN